MKRKPCRGSTLCVTSSEFELLDDMLDVVRQHYARQLHALLLEQRAPDCHTPEPNDPPF